MFSGARLVGVVIADPQGYERSPMARQIEAVDLNRLAVGDRGRFLPVEPV